jgi:pimeloyl-ACP methyl ester carboxylesterase
MQNASWLDRRAYPFAPHVFPVDGGRMHYVDEGAGRPVVMVHGLPTWSFLYRHLIGALSPGFRCVAPDHLGFGLSDKPPQAAYRPEDHARRLSGLIEQLSLREIVLIVHDFGGPIGLSYAVERPDNVAALVVCNSWMWPVDAEPMVRRADLLLRGPLGALLYERLGFSMRVMMPYAWGKSSPLTAAVHRQYRDVAPSPGDRRPQLALARALLGSGEWYAGLWARRERLRDRPALLLWGLRDPTFMGRALARWQQALPGAQVHTFPETGHFVPDEAGKQVAPLVASFLAQLG